MITYSLICLKNKDPKKIFARLIREVCGLDFNHVEILKETDIGPIKVSISYGAVSPVSRRIGLTELLDHYEIIHKIPLKVSVSTQEADLILNKLLNKPYSIMQLVIILAKMYLTKYFKWLSGIKLNLDLDLICTELVGDFERDACKYSMPESTETLTLTDVLDIALKS